MNTFKNLLIAILTGLLALTLLTQPAQSATKKYDAVKLVQYDRCLDRINQYHIDDSITNYPYEKTPDICAAPQFLAKSQVNETYDAAKLVLYDRCLERINQFYRNRTEYESPYKMTLGHCAHLKP